MAEYIEREAAIRVVNGQSSLTMTRSSLIDSISKLPAADVAPVRHGWWVHEHISEGYAWVMCSECEAVIHKILINKRLNYCPNCGAKMDGGANNEAD